MDVEDRTGVKHSEGSADDRRRREFAFYHRYVAEVGSHGGIENGARLNKLPCPRGGVSSFQLLNGVGDHPPHVIDGSNIHVGETGVGLLLTAWLGDFAEGRPAPVTRDGERAGQIEDSSRSAIPGVNEAATNRKLQHQLTHLRHGIWRVGELVELRKDRFERHALASSSRAHSISLAFSSSFEGR